MNQRVLIVDDEADFRMVLRKLLADENFVVLEAKDGEEGEKMARESKPDAIVLDWNMPRRDGVDVCKSLKADPLTKSIPILMLTSRTQESDTVVALEVGADDYISKRVLRKKELVARIRAIMRRNTPNIETGGEIIRIGKINMDTGSRAVTVAGKPIKLRMKEFDLLFVFAKRPGRVLSRNFLSETVWGDPYFGTTRTIDMTISHLRTMLGPEGHRIENLINLGYKFNA